MTDNFTNLLDDEIATRMPRVEAPTPPILAGWRKLSELGAVFDEALPPRRWLLKRDGNGVLPLGKLGIFAAAGGAGKTMACIQLALAVATGCQWLGAFVVPLEGVGRVLLALGEEDADEVRRRMYNAARAMKLTEGEKAQALKHIVVLPLAGTHVALTQSEEKGASIETDAAKALHERMTSEGNDWRLVIFDPLARFAGADAEKDNAAATRFIEMAESFCKLPGSPSVLVVHHSAQHARGSGPSQTDANRDASQVARGATAITDGARWVASLDTEYTTIEAEQLKRLAAFRVIKSNYAEPMREPLMLRRQFDHGGALVALDAADNERLEDDRKKRRGKTKKPTNDNEKDSANANDARTFIG